MKKKLASLPQKYPPKVSKRRLSAPSASISLFRCTHLFVSLKGKPLTRTGIKNIVSGCCQRCNVRTVKNALPTPHTFRHTLPTLNTAPYGKCLEPRLIQQRLGHTDFEVFERVYVHNNPLAEMKEYKKLYARDLNGGSINEIGKQDFFRTLDLLLFAKTTSIQDIKDAYERQMKMPDENLAGNQWNNMMTEDQAVNALTGFQMDYRPLRTWALKKGVCRIDTADGRRRYFYDKAHIKNLAENYIVFKEALRVFSGSRAQFHRKVKQCKRIIIGRKILILKSDLVEFLVERHSNNVMARRMGTTYTNVIT